MQYTCFNISNTVEEFVVSNKTNSCTELLQHLVICVVFIEGESLILRENGIAYSLCQNI